MICLDLPWGRCPPTHSESTPPPSRLVSTTMRKFKKARASSTSLNIAKLDYVIIPLTPLSCRGRTGTVPQEPDPTSCSGLLRHGSSALPQGPVGAAGSDSLGGYNQVLPGQLW
ncbi:hypothetical protein QAD02_002079 [Eretmocerus hayati]|uniref:Uncharacterized protein n=1 Tax=Eretmocerus hayati TaxID=131215 RepID=A0ACC2NI33_9HYME|nr:hypothetical protein QAD02_002079 [Eretmocerus hayati]